MVTGGPQVFFLFQTGNFPILGFCTPGVDFKMKNTYQVCDMFVGGPPPEPVKGASASGQNKQEIIRVFTGILY